MSATLPRNAYSRPNSERALTTHEKLRESKISDDRWRDLERDLVKMVGRDSGRAFHKMLRRGEYDFPFYCTKLLGVVPEKWQTRVKVEGLDKHPNVVVRGPNGLGKTVSYGLIYFHVATYREYAEQNWGAAGVRHLGPEQAHANKALFKMQDILGDRAREQAYRVKGGWKFRPCLLTDFIKDATVDGYPALDFFDGSGYVVFSPTANGARSADGDDPVLIGWDEVRHERNVKYVSQVIIGPRFLRVPKGRFLTMYTPDIDGNPAAVVELGAMFQRGQMGKMGWKSFQIALSENTSITAAAKKRVSDDLDPRYRAQAMEGKEVQPSHAFFPFSAITRAYLPPPEPDEFSELGDGVCHCRSCDGKTTTGFANLRTRVEGRCPKCKANEHEHPFAAAADPASSAMGADGIVFEVWDLEPPEFDGAETVYAEALAPGSEIGDIVTHADALGQLLGIEVGYDRKGALGHAVEDELYAVSSEFVGLQTDTQEQKTKWLHFFGTIMAKSAWRSPYHG
ncbi:MAG: hypothetical protein M3003_09530, partial [Candidatus Dormibacteraeota bacterium]|nr:hypothetical protein [Candidatus Dormibacteraeota bacterium]